MLLDKHKYAFDWKSEVQRAEEIAGVAGDAQASFWETVHKPSPISAFVGVSCGLGGLKLAEHTLHSWGQHFFHGLIRMDNVILFSTSFGALCALLLVRQQHLLAARQSPSVALRSFYRLQ